MAVTHIHNQYHFNHLNENIKNIQTIQIDMTRLKAWYIQLVEDNMEHLIQNKYFLESVFGYENFCNEIVTTLSSVPSQ